MISIELIYTLGAFLTCIGVYKIISSKNVLMKLLASEIILAGVMLIIFSATAELKTREISAILVLIAISAQTFLLLSWVKMQKERKEN